MHVVHFVLKIKWGATWTGQKMLASNLYNTTRPCIFLLEYWELFTFPSHAFKVSGLYFPVFSLHNGQMRPLCQGTLTCALTCRIALPTVLPLADPGQGGVETTPRNLLAPKFYKYLNNYIILYIIYIIYIMLYIIYNI